MRLQSIQFDWIDQWNLGPDDRHSVADLDGDGLDEVYIRSAHWAGVLKWQGGRFRLLWIGHLALSPLDGTTGISLPLRSTDESYVGRFFADRDGVLHQYLDDEKGVAVLRWDGSRVGIKRFESGGLLYDSPLGERWTLGPADRFVVGLFTRGGPDPGNPSQVYITPDQAGVFIHNGWATAKLGVNRFVDPSAGPMSEIGLTWINPRELMQL
jgi:hypothetical protein